MRLTRYIDYSPRVLPYLSGREDEIVANTELAGLYRISRNHLAITISTARIHDGESEPLSSVND